MTLNVVLIVHSMITGNHLYSGDFRCNPDVHKFTYWKTNLWYQTLSPVQHWKVDWEILLVRVITSMIGDGIICCHNF